MNLTSEWHITHIHTSSLHQPGGQSTSQHAWDTHRLSIRPLSSELWYISPETTVTQPVSAKATAEDERCRHWGADTERRGKSHPFLRYSEPQAGSGRDKELVRWGGSQFGAGQQWSRHTNLQSTRQDHPSEAGTEHPHDRSTTRPVAAWPCTPTVPLSGHNTGWPRHPTVSRPRAPQRHHYRAGLSTVCLCVYRAEVKEKVVWVDTKKTKVKNKAGKLKEKVVTILEVRGGRRGWSHGHLSLQLK